MYDMLDGFRQHLGDFDDAAGIRARYAEELGRLGVKNFAFTSLNVPEMDGENFFLSTYPVEYTTIYMREQFRDVDPVLEISKTTFRPFEWDIAQVTREGEGSDAGRKMLGIAADFGISQGITVPIHGPGFRYAALHVTHDFKSGGLASDKNGLAKELIYIAYCLNATVNENIHAEMAETATKLTVREIECLKWIARGKTSWDISILLNVSEATVISHAKNAMTKLGVYNRPHAVVKAIMLGYINP